MYITPFEVGLIVGSIVDSFVMCVLDGYSAWQRYKIRQEEKDR